MAKNLVIVESPAKCRTIEKYLGADFQVMASYGHVRDLVPKLDAVDPEADFALRYEPIERNRKHVDAIMRALKRADRLLLATDPDREGEAISWHLLELLQQHAVLNGKTVQRVAFNEITRQAVKRAMEEPRQVSVELVDSQQARRALDFLVGFRLSPLLWRKIRSGLSAGRVQSPALRMVVEREQEIEAFKPREYWTIEAETEAEGQTFRGRLVCLDGQKISQFSIVDESAALAARALLEKAADGTLLVAAIERGQRRRQPGAPFITSSLQQEASRRLGFTPSRTMRVAQQLYEGIDTGADQDGLITYMRTDSPSLASSAVEDLRAFIRARYGAEALPSEARQHRARSRNAQEAHEAIRPTDVQREPSTLKGALDADQYRLYDLIWRRSVACQMMPALYDTMAVTLHAGSAANQFRVTGSTLRSPGFLAVYQDTVDDDEKKSTDNKDRLLPPLQEQQRVPLQRICNDQHFTEPPPRYSDASLIRKLEEYGIGRPSTYAAIISTLLDRDYVEQQRRRLLPTETGRVVNRFLCEHFKRYVDYDFTARLEDDLDAVSRGEQQWKPLLERFWQPFKSQLEAVSEVSQQEAVPARQLGVDPASDKPVSVRFGRYGPYAQIGSREDEEKPRYASLLPDQKLDQVTLEEALALFRLPRHLGNSRQGQPVEANIGRYGPYIKHGERFISLREDDPYSIELEAAQLLIDADQEAAAKRLIKDFAEQGIKILNGRFGPYVSDGKINAKVPKDQQPEELSLDDCRRLLEERARRPARSGGRRRRSTR